MVLIRPVFGEPRMVQATPATSGGANSGRMLAAAMKRLNGVLVRTTIQENASPIATAIKVPPPQATSVLNSAFAQHGEEVGDREMGQAEALDHRIGVGERAKQQGEKRVNDQKGQDGEQRQNPRRRDHTAAATRMRLLQRALQRRCQLGQSAPLRRRLALFRPWAVSHTIGGRSAIISITPWSARWLPGARSTAAGGLAPSP